MSQKIVQPEGNYFDKYNSKNPIHVLIMMNFFRHINKLLSNMQDKPNNILEAGCGEGYVSAHIYTYMSLVSKNNIIYDAYDISEKVIKQAQIDFPKINFSVGDIYNTSNQSYDLVVACEVLEHLEEPLSALKKLIDISKRYIFVSVPNEPLWRILNMARGSYISSFGNSPGHIQHWSERSFKKLLSMGGGIQIVAMSKPIPWQMYLLEKI